MTVRIGPPGWQNEWQGQQDSDEVGAYFGTLAGMGAPYYPPPGYAQLAQQLRSPYGMPMAPPNGRFYGPPPMPPQYPQQYPQYPQYQGPGIPSGRIIPTIPGAPQIGVKLQPLGFGAITFTATSGTALPASTRPQKPFKGRRLIVALARTGATATGLVSIASLTIGVNNQFVSTGAVGADAFGPGAFDANVELSACSTALDITINYTISAAPTATDTVAISSTLFGETVGS